MKLEPVILSHRKQFKYKTKVLSRIFVLQTTLINDCSLPYFTHQKTIASASCNKNHLEEQMGGFGDLLTILKVVFLEWCADVGVHGRVTNLKQ